MEEVFDLGETRIAFVAPPATIPQDRFFEQLVQLTPIKLAITGILYVAGTKKLDDWCRTVAKTLQLTNSNERPRGR